MLSAYDRGVSKAVVAIAELAGRESLESVLARVHNGVLEPVEPVLDRMLERNKLSYTQTVEHFTKHMPFLSESDKEWVMGRAICECLNWPIK